MNFRHAVDWIQEEGKLRVLVGKYSTTMFTLNIPQGYPDRRGITLLQTPTTEEMDTSDVCVCVIRYVACHVKKMEI